MSNILSALLLALWAYLCMTDMLGTSFFMGFRPLIAGFGAGLIVGDVQTGLMIGGTLELMALGVYNYGGASIPDFTVGAILGTFFGKGGNYEVGIALAIPAALLLTQMDVIAGMINNVFVHKADKFAEVGDVKGFDRMMYLFSHVPYGLSRGLPVFVAVALGEPAVKVVGTFFDTYPWISNGINTAGGILPALGFAMLLKIMPVGKFPAFLILGFVLYAFMDVPLVGLALSAVAVSLIYQYTKNQKMEA